MALRENLAERAGQYLEQGEQIQAIFLAQSGPSPYWSLLSSLIVVFAAGYRTIVVTDRAYVILRNGRLSGTRPKAVASRQDREVRLGHPTGLWGSITLDRRYWVHKRFHKDVRAADDALDALLAARPPR